MLFHGKQIVLWHVSVFYPEIGPLTPGALLLRAASRFCSPESCEEILEPTILDVREEYGNALAAGQLEEARWVLVRGYWSFLCAVTSQMVVEIGRSITKPWRLRP